MRVSKYGRLCNDNREQYREDVNFLYWRTSCTVAKISRKLGISEISVTKLIGEKPGDVELIQKRKNAV